MTSGDGLFKRCGCHDSVSGRRLRIRCPRLARRGHGSWYFRLEPPPGQNGKRRHRDAPVPMIVVVLFIPYYIGAGFLAARHGGIASAVTTGAVTALTGHVVVFGATVLYTFINGTRPAALARLFLGAVAGVAGGMLAKVIQSIRLTAGNEPARRQVMSSGSPSRSGRIVSCGGRPRS